MSNKPLSQLSHDEILRQQLELLAVRSQEALIEELPQLTSAMVEIHNALAR